MKTKTKIIRVSLAVELFNWVKYIAKEEDGSLWGFRCEPYANVCVWQPSNLIGLCQCFVTGFTQPCPEWKSTLQYVGDGKKRQKVVFDIRVPDNSKYIFMNQVGSVFVSNSKPTRRKNNDLWICNDATCVLNTKQGCKEWKKSLREIQEQNVVRWPWA
jgi:hypothetical protein